MLLNAGAGLTASILGFFLWAWVIGRPFQLLPTDYVDVEIVDSLMCIFTTVHDYAVAFNVLLAANFSDSDHQVANKCFIF